MQNGIVNMFSGMLFSLQHGQRPQIDMY
jgi:hypothetical protein